MNWLKKTLDRPVWRGKYSDFKSVPVSGPGFDGKEWLNQSKERLEKLLKEDHPVDPAVLMLASIAATLKNPVRIFDFGGNLGFTYVLLSKMMTSNVQLEYHIQERPAICAEAAKVFKNEASVYFHDSMPDNTMSFDIVFMSSVLQYIENYRQVMDQMLAFKPQYLLLANFSGTRGTTFATAQSNVPGSVIPYWFIGLEDINQMVSRGGMSPSFQSVNSETNSIQGSRGVFMNLLYRRNHE